MVLPFKKAVAETAATYTVYGKLPNRADFVRVNANHAVVVEFDELIQRTLERLALDDSWAQAYDDSQPVEFQYISRDTRHAVMGVLAPSMDMAGRRYPLLAAAILPSEAMTGFAPHIIPIAYEVFFDGLREQVCTAIDNSVEALSCSQFLESQVRRNDKSTDDFGLASNVVERFMHSTSIADMASLLEADQRALNLEQVLLNLAFYRAFLRRFDTPSSNQIISLPLPATKGVQALWASAWLSILAAVSSNDGASRWNGTYMLQSGPQHAATLAACFSPVHDKLTTVMLGGRLDATMSLDLRHEQEAWKAHRLYAEVSYALGRLLGDTTAPLSVLCSFLKDVSCKLEHAA